uniref:DDE-1 domain-containing protein n=1 Tax=Amphimedon queenslandica TaxID=400682 RepID=A0A1X7UV48_AMPQE
MAEQGSSQVPVIGKEDKRETTVLLAVTASGTLLPPQLIYQRKTVGCHPKITFPTKWNVTHSESHWSTTETMIEYLDTVLIPYVVETRQELELADDQRALALFDVFAAHHSNEVLSKIRANYIHQILVPASCTGELQPLDVRINGDFKQLMKASFSRWYSDDVRAAMDEGQSVSDI